MAPDLELEWFEMMESAIRSGLGNLRGREDLMQLVNERFGTMIDVAPTKAVLTEDPVKEMEVLTSMYLAPLARGEQLQPCRGKGRLAIVSTIKDEFAKIGVLELIQRDLDVGKYTGPGDPFRIDFGYRAGGLVKMFHAISVASNVDPALALLYRYSLVATGMREEGLQASLTAVVDERSALAEERTLFAIGRLKQHSVRVESVEMVAEVASEVHRDAAVGRLERVPAA